MQNISRDMSDDETAILLPTTNETWEHWYESVVPNILHFIMCSMFVDQEGSDCQLLLPPRYYHEWIQGTFSCIVVAVAPGMIDVLT